MQNIGFDLEGNGDDEEHVDNDEVDDKNDNDNDFHMNTRCHLTDRTGLHGHWDGLAAGAQIMALDKQIIGGYDDDDGVADDDVDDNDDYDDDTT